MFTNPDGAISMCVKCAVVLIVTTMPVEFHLTVMADFLDQAGVDRSRFRFQFRYRSQFLVAAGMIMMGMTGMIAVTETIVTIGDATRQGLQQKRGVVGSSTVPLLFWTGEDYRIYSN